MSGRRPFADATARRHQPPDRSFDLQHLRLEIGIDVDRCRIRGRATQTFAPLVPELSTLALDAAELEVGAVTLEGAPLAFDSGGGKLRIRLPRPFALGERFEVTVEYQARPRTGLWFIGPDDGYPGKPRQIWTQGQQENTRYWIPTWDYPNDRATSEVIVTVPQTFLAVANGELVAERFDAAAGTRTFHWRLERAHVPYLLSLVAGEWDQIEDRSPSGVRLRYLVPPGRGKDIERAFASTPRILEYFAEWTAVAYPWPRYTQTVVHDFVWGGMENTSATTLTERTLHDERAHLDYRSEPLVAHELAHQWWGDLVTCRSWEHIWLNEGFATYFEVLWREHDQGVDERDYDLLEKADRYFQEDLEEYRRPIVQATYTDPADLFDRHTYEKAAWVLHMLRHLLGDETFQRGLRAYLARHRDALAETDELRIVLEETTGRQLGWFFDQWLRHPGFPEIQVSSRFDEAAGLIHVHLRQTQDGADGTPTFRLPLVLRLWDEPSGGKHAFRDFRVELTEREQVVVVPCPAPPRAVTVDPGNFVLKRLDLLQPVEHRILELQAAPAAVDRALAARALGPAASDAAIAALGRALAGDRFWGVRVQAARALGASRGEAAFAALLAGLADPDSRVRSAVCEALGDARDPRAAEALGRVLNGDDSYYARAEAVRSLGRIRGEGAFAAIVAALSQESHQDIVRQKALDGLAELGDKQAIAVARDWAAYGRPPKAREAALKTLGRLGSDTREVRELLEQTAAKDPSLWARFAAIQALGELGDEAAMATLERSARLELDARLRRMARRSMEKVREKLPGAERLRRDLEALREESARQGRRISSLEGRLVEELK